MKQSSAKKPLSSLQQALYFLFNRPYLEDPGEMTGKEESYGNTLHKSISESISISLTFQQEFPISFFYYYFPFFLLLKELFPRVQFILSLLFVFDRLSYTLFKTWNSLNFHFCLIFFSFHLFSLYSLQDCLYLTIFSSSF